jgi:uncharacterized protein (UPF0305 family)
MFLNTKKKRQRQKRRGRRRRRRVKKESQKCIYEFFWEREGRIHCMFRRFAADQPIHREFTEYPSTVHMAS